MDRRFGLIITALVIGFAGIFWFNSRSKQSNGSTDTKATVTSHVQGAGTKGVTLIEYGDFECPACGQYFPILKEIKSRFGDDIAFQFRHFPLPSHPQARAAHRAAEAAGRQGKFFEMHDMLYTRQDAWSGNTAAARIFEGYAQELSLDMDKFRADVASESVNATINADITAGQAAGATGTPTFVLNGKTIPNPRGLDEFVKVIEDAINQKSVQ